MDFRPRLRFRWLSGRLSGEGRIRAPESEPGLGPGLVVAGRGWDGMAFWSLAGEGSGDLADGEMFRLGNDEKSGTDVEGGPGLGDEVASGEIDDVAFGGW